MNGTIYNTGGTIGIHTLDEVSDIALTNGRVSYPVRVINRYHNKYHHLVAHAIKGDKLELTINQERVAVEVPAPRKFKDFNVTGANITILGEFDKEIVDIEVN